MDKVGSSDGSTLNRRGLSWEVKDIRNSIRTGNNADGSTRSRRGGVLVGLQPWAQTTDEPKGADAERTWMQLDATHKLFGFLGGRALAQYFEEDEGAKSEADEEPVLLSKDNWLQLDSNHQLSGVVEKKPREI